MKKLLSAIMFMLVSLAAMAQSDYERLAPEDQKRLGNAVGLVNSGMTQAAMDDFDYLVKKYPGNYMIQYERLYNLYMLGQYYDVINAGKKLLKHKNAEDLAFQMVGNAYDITGDPKEAVKIYERGLKRFPHSGSLCLELGNMAMGAKEYVKALEYYNKGIEVQPDFASNYYRAALLYLSSTEAKVWGLVYAESEILLAPNNSDRHKDMASMMVSILNESTEVDSVGRPSVHLVSSREMKVDKNGGVVYLGFPGIYEAALNSGLRSVMKDSTVTTPVEYTFTDMSDMRRVMVENYFSVTGDLYGESMYLLQFLKKVMDAGHWEAYNYFLFKDVFRDDFAAWYGENEAKFDAFIDWYNDAPYKLGDGRSVDPAQIYRHYRPINFLEAIMIQGKFLEAGDLSGK